MLATAALVGFTAYRTAFPRTTVELAGEEHLELWSIALIGVGAGALGLLGVGGGILMVPAFSVWLGMPLKETVATSLACVGVFAIPGRSRTRCSATSTGRSRSRSPSVSFPVRASARTPTIMASDKTLRYAVGAVLGIVATIYAVGEILALFD